MYIRQFEGIQVKATSLKNIGTMNQGLQTGKITND